MKLTLNKIAAILAFTLGGLSILAGGMAMHGWNPGYFVLNWLPVYNFIMGVLTVFIPAMLIWRNSRYATPVAIAALGIHATVTVLLLSAFRGTPAAQSILAMFFRVAVWLIILALMFFQARKNNEEIK
jgi:FtsH-binding integral membrane protein